MTAVKMLWGPASLGGVYTTTSSLLSNTLSDSDNAVAWMFCIPRDGTVTDVGFYISAKGGTPPAYNAGLVTLDSSGRPTTTAYGGSAVTEFTPTTTGWLWVTLSTAATANAGDFAAVHIYPTASTPTGTNNIAITRIQVADIGGTPMYYASSWSTVTYASAYAIRYDDNSIHGLALASNTVHVQVRSDTTPDEVGCLFQVPAAMTVYGAKFSAAGSSWGSAAAADIVLYNAADTVLATAAISDKDFVDDNETINVFFDSVSLSANTNYRLIIKPTVSTNGNVYTPKWTFESAAALAVIPEGTRWQYTSRTDAGAWSNDSSSIMPLGLWVSDITFTTTSGGGGEYAYIG